MSDQTIYEGTGSATSSPESGDGLKPCGSPDGPTIGASGPGAVPANLSARQAGEAGLLTSGTYGPPSSISSESAALRLSLENKLRRVTALRGSTLYKLTWKEKRMPSGRSYSQLVASVRRTSGSGPTSWPSPVANDAKGSGYTYRGGKKDEICLKLPGAAELAGWPTPTAALADKGVRSPEGGVIEAMRSKGPDLAAVACLASWATPAAKEAGGTPEQFLERKERARERGARLRVALTSLSLQAQLAAWVTPTSRDHKGDPPTPRKKGHLLPYQARLTDSGETPSGSTAGTGSIGRLNPGLSRWLQGYPAMWENCAPSGIRSSRKSRPS